MTKQSRSHFTLVSGFIGLVILFLYSCKGHSVAQLQEEADKISTKWVPDRRLGICNIQVIKRWDGKVVLRGESSIPEAKNEVINSLDKYGIYLIDSILILPDTLKTERYFGLVTLSVINLRKEPDHASELVSQSILGTPLKVLKNSNGWMLVQTPDNYVAWTESASVRPMSEKEMSEWKKQPKVIYLENTGWIYKDISDKNAVTGDVVGGSILARTGEINGYISVVLPDGREGFVEKQKTADFDTWKKNCQCTQTSVCSVAITFMGLPYLWGGTSPKAVDCSGFVQSVFFRNGYILQRDASLQALHGTTVDLKDDYINLQKGDLLFFGSTKDGRMHVTHVGLYLGGKEYINAAGRVMINSLDPASPEFVDYRLQSLLEAKRIIGVENDKGIVSVSSHPWY